MRKFHLPLTARALVAACALVTASCSKSKSTPHDSGCIERIVIALSDPGLTSSQIQTADSLFNVNHIDHSNYRYYWFEADTFRSQASPNTLHLQTMVMLDQYANGLRIFNDQLTYTSIDGAFTYISGTPTPGTSLDTVPSQALPRLRAQFTADLPKTGISPIYEDSCYTAEFGYYNIAPYNTPENLIKAWRVTIHSSAAYPYNYATAAIYKDSNGQFISWQGLNIPIIN